MKAGRTIGMRGAAARIAARRYAGTAVTMALLACLAACSEKSDSPTDPSPPTQSNEDSVAAVGASDVIGYGGSSPCLPFADCPDGTGYVQTTVRRLRAQGRTVTVTNLGIPGAVLSREFEDLGNSLGRGIPGNFIEREMPFVPRGATIVTIFAGGNDANTVGSAVRAGNGGSNPLDYIDGQVRNFGRDLATLVTGIRGRAPQARIVLLNLPNLAALPYVSTYPVAERSVLQRIAVGFSAQANALASSNVLVIDLMCDARSYLAGNYYSDGFHPNDAGYAFMTELVYAAATSGSAAPPRASCAQMTLLPAL
jgi:lysophospholipase L1-like esterase